MFLLTCWVVYLRKEMIDRVAKRKARLRKRFAFFVGHWQLGDGAALLVAEMPSRILVKGAYVLREIQFARAYGKVPTIGSSPR